jgi:miniconductance mechanosensitive channel
MDEAVNNLKETTGNIERWIDAFDQLLLDAGMGQGFEILLRTALVALVILGLSWLADFITKKLILRGIRTVAARSKTKLDDILIERGVFRRIAHIVPALIVYFTAAFVFKDYPVFENIFERLALVYIVIMVLLAIDSFLNALHAIYLTMPVSEGRPIKGYVQVVKIIVYFIAIILIISILMKESPKVLLGGLGAMAAVLLLVFRDTILGFVASIQLAGNKMVSPGDWIEMPSHGADGDVIDISLNTVKVQNWDKTITTIPTYTLVSESFRNWKGMEESGGRRIKRSIRIDMNTVRFLDRETADKLKKIYLLRDYIETRQEEIRKYNEEHDFDATVLVNGRRMTNLGTFRIYVEQYLKNHPKVHKGLTMMVRQLQPTETGLPIEIYAFSNDQAWVNYEAIQADIFDHILAVVPEFGLRVYQQPSGVDFQALKS